MREQPALASATAAPRPTAGPRKGPDDSVPGVGRRAGRVGGSALMAQSPAPRQAPRDPRRGDHRLRPPGLPQRPRLRRRGRGRGRLRPRLPLLRLEGPDAERALLRALGAAASRRARRSRSSDAAPREKLAGVADFIIESYRHEPELMKVIIVEVTRAANSFGRTHLPEIRQAYDLVAEIVADAQEAGEFRDDVRPELRRDALLRRDRAAAHRLDLRARSRPRTRTTSAPSGWWSRRSATAWSPGPSTRWPASARVCGKDLQGPSARTGSCTGPPSSPTSCSASCCCRSGCSASWSAAGSATS